MSIFLDTTLLSIYHYLNTYLTKIFFTQLIYKF